MPEPIESEQSLIRKAGLKMKENEAIQAALRWGFIALLSAGSGYATREVGNAQHDAKLETTYTDTKRLDERVEQLRDGFAQRVNVEEREREEDIAKLRERIRRLESDLDELRRGR